MSKHTRTRDGGNDDHALYSAKKLRSKESRIASFEAGSKSLTSDTSTRSTPRKASTNHRRYNITDPSLSLHDKLTSEEGQLEENPYYSLEQAREAAQREYNRRNAARGRIRRKYLLNELQEKYDSMELESEALQKENAALKRELAETKRIASTLRADNNMHMIRQAHGLHVLPSSMLQQGWAYSLQPLVNALAPQNQHQCMIHRELPTPPPSQNVFPPLLFARARVGLDANPYQSDLPGLTVRTRNPLFNAERTAEPQLMTATDSNSPKIAPHKCPNS